jgi:DinB superfamily
MTSPDPLALLEQMPAWLAAVARAIGEDRAREPGPDGGFSLVEQAWHLADLEREGYGERLRRLRDEEAPRLSDFDGARVARERDYRSLPLAAALATFAAARSANLALLRGLDERARERTGEQEGVGAVRLGDVPRMMTEHDAVHRAELEVLAGSLGSP